jgi:LysR family transcriptional regulator for metE and metH
MRLPAPALEIRDIRLMQAIASEGTLARASLRLNLTPSALSHHLLALEGRVGTSLCQRVGRRMSLTPAGARLAEAGGRVLEALAEAERAVGGAEPAREIVRLATECHTTYYWLPSVIQAFERSSPHVDVRLAPDNGGRPAADVLAGQVDAAIVTHRAKDRRLRYLPIFNDELVAVVGPGHPWAVRPFVTAPDFATEHLIHYANTKSELSVFKEVLRPAGVQPRRTSPMLLTEAILEMVRSGLGVAVLAHWAVVPYVERGQVHAVRITRHGIRRQWCLAVQAAAARRPAIVELVAALRAPGVFKIKKG